MIILYLLYIIIALSHIVLFINKSESALDVSKIASEYCSPEKRVVITRAYRHRQQKYIYALFDKNCYSRVVGVTRKHLPIIDTTADKQWSTRLMYPKCDWNEAILNDEFEEYTDYAFDTEFATYWLNNRSLIGFNHVWLGCPQQMCISGGIDAIYHSFQNNKLIFRGRHYWRLLDDFSADKPIPLIASIKDITGSTSDGYFDASFRTYGPNRKDNALFLIKGEDVWWQFAKHNLKDKNRMSVFKLFGTKFPANVDTVFYQRIADIERLYIFKDGMYYIGKYTNKTLSSGASVLKIWKISDGPKSVKQLNPTFPHQIDAIHQSADIITIYFQWQYFSINSSRKWFDEAWLNVNLRFHWVFADQYKCQLDAYKRWQFDSYESFINRFAINSKNIARPALPLSTFADLKDAENSTLTTQFSNQNSSKSIHWSIILLIVCAIVIIVIIVAVIVVILKRNLNKQRTLKLKKKMADREPVDPRFGQLDSSTNITVNVSTMSDDTSFPDSNDPKQTDTRSDTRQSNLTSKTGLNDDSESTLRSN